MSKASAYFTLNNIGGKHDAQEIKRRLDVMPGVSSVSINDSYNNIAVDYDTSGVQSGHIKKQLEKMGCEIAGCEVKEHKM